MREPTKLTELLVNLEHLIVDDAGAEEQARAIERGQRYEAEVARREVLVREGVALTEPMERAIVTGGETLALSRPVRAVRAWLKRDDVPPVLVLSGGTGTGKSVAAAHALCERRAGIWRTAAQLCRVFAASFGDQYEDQELCLTAGMLVADDVGAELESARERMAATLIELLEHRKRSARVMRTVITTNLNRREFEARYANARLLSRMSKEAGVVAWAETQDGDMRKGQR